MKPLRCDFCNGSLIMDKSREFATCEFCGTKYMKDIIQQKIQEIRGEISIVGAVETVTGNAEKERLLKNAETYFRIKEYSKAMQTFKQVTQLFPEDYRGWWGIFTTQVYSYYFSGSFQCVEPRALSNARQLHPNQAEIDSFLNDMVIRYGKMIRLSRNSIPFTAFVKPEHVPASVDSFTLWIIYQLSLNESILTPPLRDLCISLTNQYVKKIRTGEIIPTHYFIRPTLYKGEWNINLHNANTASITQFIAAKLHVNCSVQNTPYSIYNEVTTITFTRVCDIIGRWAILKNYDSLLIVLMHYPLSNLDYSKYFNICPYCGGRFKGTIKKVCTKCGKPKE